MSATSDLATEQDGAARPSGGSQLPAASLAESLSVLATGIVPPLVRGLFSPRRRAMKLLAALDADRRAVSVLSGLRRRHGGQGLRLLGGRIVVVWGPWAIKEVLDRSADLYASDAGAKAKGMSHFQPQALTLSRGEEWRDRRNFAESVLAARERLHPSAQRFVDVVADEIERLPGELRLDWGAWEGLFDHVTLRVIFGDSAREEQRLTALLEQLMGEANRLVGLKPGDEYYEFYGLLERQLAEPEEGSLLARFADAPHGDRTRIVHQIPHWIFAMRDTLGANAFRALAAVVADDSLTRRVREELEGQDLRAPEAVDGLGLLEGCLQEAMRLWPTTPLLARETTRETELAGEKLQEGTQVMLVNVFNHRDPDGVADPDLLVPERWVEGGSDIRFNHLSNGSQDCPGAPLVSLLGKAALAGVLARYELTLERPQLDPGQLPFILNFYEMCLSARSREHR
ncbi:MAG: cytochrome P450 [Actinomycetota bacterium]|nr:cytochrome P450 [Actinomycetota bacterium]